MSVINHNLNLSELPALPIAHCTSLPNVPAVYFAIADIIGRYIDAQKNKQVA